jgi:hypothetical protein
MIKVLFKIFAAVTGTVLLVLLYSFTFARYNVRLNEYEAGFKNLPPEFDGYRIALFADLHYGKFSGMRFAERAVRMANSAGADMIICAGDYVRKRDTSSELSEIFPVLMKLSAPDGVYMILGNHDHWASSRAALKLLQRSGRSIRHRSVIIKRGKGAVALAGAGDRWSDTSGLDSAFKDIPAGMFKIAAAHNPETADMKRSVKIDLFLSGHTHGGQVGLPFDPRKVPYLNRLKPVRYYGADSRRGFHKSRFKEKIFITTGIGWSIYPFRFNSPPEIAVITLRKK